MHRTCPMKNDPFTCTRVSLQRLASRLRRRRKRRRKRKRRRRRKGRRRRRKRTKERKTKKKKEAEEEETIQPKPPVRRPKIQCCVTTSIEEGGNCAHNLPRKQSLTEVKPASRSNNKKHLRIYQGSESLTLQNNRAFVKSSIPRHELQTSTLGSLDNAFLKKSVSKDGNQGTMKPVRAFHDFHA